MKKYIILSVLIFVCNTFSQVIISPYIIYTDTKNKFGTFYVQNESTQEYEIDISFVFGYPVTDSLGNPTMEYIEQPDSTFSSIANWIKAFPKKFALSPGQKQVVKMTVKPPVDLLPGTYWSRIITSASPKSAPLDTLGEGVRAQIKFVLNQITTFLYRVNPAITGIEIENFRSASDSANINVFANLIRTGNSPFFGNVKVSLSNSQGEVVAEDEQSLANYFQFVKKFQFPKNKLVAGEYIVEIKVESNEKTEFTESTLEGVQTVTKNFTLKIP